MLHEGIVVLGYVLCLCFRDTPRGECRASSGTILASTSAMYEQLFSREAAHACQIYGILFLRRCLGPPGAFFETVLYSLTACRLRSKFAFRTTAFTHTEPRVVSRTYSQIRCA